MEEKQNKNFSENPSIFIEPVKRNGCTLRLVIKLDNLIINRSNEITIDYNGLYHADSYVNTKRAYSIYGPLVVNAIYGVECRMYFNSRSELPFRIDSSSFPLFGTATMNHNGKTFRSDVMIGCLDPLVIYPKEGFVEINEGGCDEI